MKVLSVITVAVTAAILVVAIGAEPPTLDDVKKDFLQSLPEGAVKNVHSFETNGFHVESSTHQELIPRKGADGKLQGSGKHFDLLTVSAPGMFQVWVEKGRVGDSNGGGVLIRHRESRQPLLSVGDRDGDGRIDLLTYSVYAAGGEYVLEVIDYEADGQADMRIHFKDNFFEIWHAGQWRRVEKRGEQRSILVDGKVVQLRRGDNRWIVPAQPGAD
jgi:hypothetical protein